MSILLGIFLVGPMATLCILHGAISVGTLRSRGTRRQSQKAESQGPDGRTGRLTYIPDNESVSPSRSFPPASHSGEGPIIEAIWIPGGKNRTENLEGLEQATDPFAKKHPFLTIVAMKM